MKYVRSSFPRYSHLRTLVSRRSKEPTSIRNAHLPATWAFEDVSSLAQWWNWKWPEPSSFVEIIYTTFVNTIDSKNDTRTCPFTCRPAFGKKRHSSTTNVSCRAFDSLQWRSNRWCCHRWRMSTIEQNRSIQRAQGRQSSWFEETIPKVLRDQRKKSFPLFFLANSNKKNRFVRETQEHRRFSF